LVNSARVARRRRKQVDHEYLNSDFQELDRLFHEIPQGGTAVLISRRNDFDHGDDTPEMMPNDDSIRPAGKNVFGGTLDEPGRWSLQRRHAGLANIVPRRPLFSLDGEHVRFPQSDSAFDESRNSLGQSTRVKRIGDADRPALVKVVK